jgi:ParB-like chromosome segregation protein Spo0J
MQIQDVELDDLVLDPALNLRDRLDDDTVTRYMDSWGRMPPVVVWSVDGRLLLADGFHRHAAAVSLGKRRMPAEVREGEFAEALDYVAAVNLAHGLPLTRAERRRAVEIRLRLHHDRSDRHLAEEMGVGRELVAKVRRQLVEAGQIPAGSVRVGADGKSYPAAALPRDPNEHLPRGPMGGDGQEDPRDRGARESDRAPWDDAIDPMPPLERAPSFAATAAAVAPWDDEAVDAKVLARAPGRGGRADDRGDARLMTRQVLEVLSWTQADGFAESYRTASANARGLCQTAALKLATRADQLRKS